ncbi:MAG: radical SAM protein [Candidatus Thorarchaeota archaeon]
MTNDIIYVDKKSKIPLMGVDFIGIVDRSTNVIELKPVTLCNLKCKYCFVNAGDYSTNFIVNSAYLIEEVKKAINIKGSYNIEIHLAPYGEILLYPELYKLLSQLWELEGIKIISMQSNGLLLSKEIIKKLSKFNLTRINISLNTLNEKKASYLCDCKQYNLENLIENIHLLLDSSIDVLIAPVWFPNQNDEDIEDIIKFIIELRSKGYSKQKIQIGIQKYLIYKTGRKLKKIHPKSWDFFYKQLTDLEKKYNIKLKLGPIDFGIHKRSPISYNFNLKKNDIIELEIVSRGRWNHECIGKINEDYGIKVLLKKPLVFSKEILNKKIRAEIIKINYKDNILTALFPA